ncbi:MAG: DMT family transporter [Nitrospirae bacterium]|nr:DMT family transporter [Nitrospirota bacterium]
MKTFIVIFLATVSAAIGESLLSYGMKKNGEVDLSVLSGWINLVLSVIRNPYVLVGVLCLAVFFFLYLAALSWADLSFVMPLTAMSYIFAALLAKFALKEDVSWSRWAGTVVITLGIMFIALDSKQKSDNAVVPEKSQAFGGLNGEISGYAQSTGKEGNS